MEKRSRSGRPAVAEGPVAKKARSSSDAQDVVDLCSPVKGRLAGGLSRSEIHKQNSQQHQQSRVERPIWFDTPGQREAVVRLLAEEAARCKVSSNNPLGPQQRLCRLRALLHHCRQTPELLIR